MKKILLILALFLSASLIMDYPTFAQESQPKNMSKIPKLKALKDKDMAKHLSPLEKKGEWGFADENGKFVIKPVFTEAKSFMNGVALVKCETKWGAIKRDGTNLFEPQFDELTDFYVRASSEVYYAYANNDGKWGLLAASGEMILDCEYEGIFIVKDNASLSNGWAYIVKKNGSYGIANNPTPDYIDISYDDIGICSSGYGHYQFLSRINEDVKVFEGCGIIASQKGEDGFICMNASGVSLGITISHIPEFNENGSAIVKDLKEQIFVLYQGSAFSFNDYNMKMKVENYTKDKVLPEWAQIYKKGQNTLEPSSVDYGTLYPRFVYKTLRVGAFEEIQAFGIIDNNGKWLLKPVIERNQQNTVGEWTVYPCDIYGSSIICHNGKYGRIKREGISIPLVFDSYDEVALYDGFDVGKECYAVVSLECDKEYHYKYGFASNDGLFIPIQYYSEQYSGNEYDIRGFDSAGNTIVKIKEGTELKDVIINKKNNKKEIPEGVSAFEYIKVLERETWSNIALAPARTTQESLYGYINAEGEMIIPEQYSKAYPFVNGLALVLKYSHSRRGSRGLYGFIDKQGNEVIPVDLDHAREFSEGLAAVGLDLYGTRPRWGFIDETGKQIVDYIYESVEDFHDGLARVEQDGLYGYIDKTGKVVIPCIYAYCFDFYDGLALIKRDGLYGFIDKTGKMVIPCKYSVAYDFHNGYALVHEKSSNYYGFIDTNGSKMGNLGDLRYIRTGDFVCDELVNYYSSIENKYGYVNVKGAMIIPYGFSKARGFSEQRAVVSNGLRYGYIDKSGKVIFPIVCELARDFRGGFAAIERDSRWGFIDKNGKEVVICIYQEVGDYHCEMAWVTNSHHYYGVVNQEGDLIIPCHFEEIGDFGK